MTGRICIDCKWTFSDDELFMEHLRFVCIFMFVEKKDMTYAQLKCQITDGKFIRLNRDFSFYDLTEILEGAIKKKLLKKNKKVIVWIKGFHTKRIILYTPK